MTYTVHILGTQPYEVQNREEALWHLGAKYGAGIFNQALREGLITFTETFVKVIPFVLEESKTVFINGKRKIEYTLKRI
jgi:hypothetical protein